VRCANAVCTADGALAGLTSLLGEAALIGVGLCVGGGGGSGCGGGGGGGGAGAAAGAVAAAAAVALLTRIPAVAARVVSTEGMVGRCRFTPG